jgi:hypothetical protein
MKPLCRFLSRDDAACLVAFSEEMTTFCLPLRRLLYRLFCRFLFAVRADAYQLCCHAIPAVSLTVPITSPGDGLTLADAGCESMYDIPTPAPPMVTAVSASPMNPSPMHPCLKADCAMRPLRSCTVMLLTLRRCRL